MVGGGLTSQLNPCCRHAPPPRHHARPRNKLATNVTLRLLPRTQETQVLEAIIAVHLQAYDFDWDQAQGRRMHSEFTWTCPECRRHVPDRLGTCRCGYQGLNEFKVTPVHDREDTGVSALWGSCWLDRHFDTPLRTHASFQTSGALLCHRVERGYGGSGLTTELMVSGHHRYLLCNGSWEPIRSLGISTPRTGKECGRYPLISRMIG